jgi:hypothetical protein
METNKQLENMEAVFQTLAEMRLAKSQRAQIAGMLNIAFVNGFHAALAEQAGVTEETERYDAVSRSETVRHVNFLARESGK